MSISSSALANIRAVIKGISNDVLISRAVEQELKQFWMIGAVAAARNF